MIIYLMFFVDIFLFRFRLMFQLELFHIFLKCESWLQNEKKWRLEIDLLEQQFDYFLQQFYSFFRILVKLVDMI